MCSEITAIMPAYNAAEYIETAILSVLRQTIPCQLIIVDDASTDDTLAVAGDYVRQYPGQICLIRNETNRGVATSRNIAVEMADTEYVAFLDADDWWSVDKLEIQLDAMRVSGADVCYSGRELMNPDGSQTGKLVQVPKNVDYRQLLKGNVVPCSSVVLRRELALQYPMVHDELHEDYIMWLSMLKDGLRFTGVNQPMLKSRLGEAGKSRNKLKSAQMTYGVYRYFGIPVWKTGYYFVCYALNGFRKYAKVKR